MSSNYDSIKDYLNPDGTLDLDKVVGAGGGGPPLGQYVAKLTSIEVQAPRTENDFPALACSFTVAEGDYKDLDSRVWWKLMALPPKKPGQPMFAPDIHEIKAAAANVGAPITGPFPILQPEMCKKIVAKALGKKLLSISITEREYEQNGEKKRQRVLRVLGLAKPASSAPATASSEDEGDDLV